MEVYKQWFLRTVFRRHNNSSTAECHNQTFILLPISNVAPNYRDIMSPSPHQQSGLDELFCTMNLGSRTQ